MRTDRFLFPPSDPACLDHERMLLERMDLGFRVEGLGLGHKRSIKLPLTLGGLDN